MELNRNLTLKLLAIDVENGDTIAKKNNNLFNKGIVSTLLNYSPDARSYLLEDDWLYKPPMGKETTKRDIYYGLIFSNESLNIFKNNKNVDYGRIGGYMFGSNEIFSESYHALYHKFKKNKFNSYNLIAAMAKSWTELRLETPLYNKISREQLINSTLKKGCVNIITNPSQATIQINSKPISEITNTEVWLYTGKYHLRLTKSGYKDIEMEINLPEVDKIDINKKLELLAPAFAPTKTKNE